MKCVRRPVEEEWLRLTSYKIYGFFDIHLSQIRDLLLQIDFNVLKISSNHFVVSKEGNVGSAFVIIRTEVAVSRAERLVEAVFERQILVLMTQMPFADDFVAIAVLWAAKDHHLWHRLGFHSTNL